MTLLGYQNTEIKMTAGEPGATWTQEAALRWGGFKDNCFLNPPSNTNRLL